MGGTPRPPVGGKFHLNNFIFVDPFPKLVPTF